MNVLMITGEYPPMNGGIAGYTELLCTALEQDGVRTSVLADSRSSAEHVVDRWSWSLCKHVEALTESEDIDVVHIQFQAGAFQMHPAVNLLPRMVRNTPVVTTFHDLRPPYLFPKAGGSRFALMKRMARWSDAVVATNPVDERVLAESGVHPVAIRLGPSLPAPEDVPVRKPFGFFGFPSRQKGFDTLIEAVGNIPESDLRQVLIVGGNPPDTGHHGFMTRRDVESMARRQGVSLEWTGYLDAQDASNALAGCRVIACPFPAGASLRSSALIATLQTGRPVVTTAPNIPGDLEELASMEQLRLVEPGNLPELVNALNDALVHHPSSPAGGSLPTAFQWATIAAQHRQMYASLSGQRCR